MELKRKGLSSDIIEQVISEIDEETALTGRLSTGRAGYRQTDYQAFRQRLGGYLGRRGFSYSVIKETTERVWKEKNTLETVNK